MPGVAPEYGDGTLEGHAQQAWWDGLGLGLGM